VSESLRRSRKPRQGRELVCETVFRPLAHVLVVPLARVGTPPPLVAVGSACAGLAAALQLASGRLLLAAVLLQLKTVLDNADGQLARLTGRVTALGRYLDSELDLLVNGALFAGLAWWTGDVLAAIAGSVALTAVLSVNFNLERLYRVERQGRIAVPDEGGRATAAARRAYGLLYGWQDRLVEGLVEGRLRGRRRPDRLTYHDPAAVAVLANLGLSTQLAVFGALLALGRPLAFVWLLCAELVVVAGLGLRREALLRGSPSSRQEVAS